MVVRLVRVAVTTISTRWLIKTRFRVDGMGNTP
jgi:hypothetical protein